LDKIDVALVGGGEAPINRPIFILFSRAKMLSTRNETPQTACRPFDMTRDGAVLGEGAAVLILEKLEHAQRRGAKIYGEISAVALTSDAYNLVAPAPDASQQDRAMKQAMAITQVSSDHLDYISAHGSSTPLNDRIETLAIKKAFGGQAYRIPISSIKSMLGHALGACTAIELVATVVAIQNQFIPPTINLNIPDPDCDLDYVPNYARPGPINFALVNNSSFGGKNSSILLKRWRDETRC
jgi:3-oxoacyl-[acyl-carrier-protein] synthase II